MFYYRDYIYYIKPVPFSAPKVGPHYSARSKVAVVKTTPSAPIANTAVSIQANIIKPTSGSAIAPTPSGSIRLRYRSDSTKAPPSQ